jgi:acyl carrier protein
MKDRDSRNVEKAEIKKILKGHFQATGGFSPVDGDDLFEKGALDSFGVVEFLNFLESRFGIQIPIEDITEANFSTVDAISELIQKQCAQG